MKRREIGDADERRTQVTLDVDRERFEGRHVEHAAALRLLGHRSEQELVDACEKGRHRFAAAGWREEQGGFATLNRGPREGLRARRSPSEDRAEPVANYGVKTVEHGRG